LADAEEYTGWKGDPSGAIRSYSGVGCPPGFRNYGGLPYIGSRWHHYGYCQVAKALSGVSLIGFDNKSIATVPLPFDLAPIGGEGCHLYLSPILIIPAWVDPKSLTGRIDFELGVIPNDTTMVGAKYYEQQMVLDPEFNTLGLRASRLATCTIGGGFTGQVPGFQFVAYGPYYQLRYEWAMSYSPKLLIVEFEL